MSNIYVPIDSSGAKKAIPIGEDILYSSLITYTKVQTIAGDPRRHSGVGATRTRKINYTTHGLLTNRGFAYEKESPIYIPWYEVVYITKYPQAFHTKKTTQYYSIARDKDYESKENFKARKKQFFAILLDIYVNALRNRLEEIKKNPEICTKKELKKQLKQLPKRISKHSKWLEKAKKKGG